MRAKQFVLMAVAAIVWAAGPLRAYIPSNDDLLNRLQEEKSDIILVGNSMQGKGINFPMLSKSLGLKVSDANFGGAMTIWQYGVIKYLIPKLEKKPKMVLVIERINNLTTPQKRMAEYRSRSLEMAKGADTSIMQRIAVRGEGKPKWDPALDGAVPPLDSFHWDFEKAVNWS